MRTEEAVRLQREWFWNRAMEFETLYDNTGNETFLTQAEAFAMVVGTLDWVLNDKAAPDEG